MNTNSTELAFDLLSGACAKCYNHHPNEDCVAVDAETLHKLRKNSYFDNAFDYQNNLMGTYMGRPVYLKRKTYENTNSR